MIKCDAFDQYRYIQYIINLVYNYYTKQYSVSAIGIQYPLKKTRREEALGDAEGVTYEAGGF